MIKTTKGYVDNSLGFKAMRWCNHNDITVYAVPIPSYYTNGNRGSNYCHIEINKQGIKKLGTEKYKQGTEVTDKILELYIHFYNRK